MTGGIHKYNPISLTIYIKSEGKKAGDNISDGRAHMGQILGTILFTEDSGQSWQVPKNLPAKDLRLNSAVFLTPAVTIVVGEGGALLRSQDGGKEWTTAESPRDATANLVKVSFLDSMNGLAVGDHGTILRTIDGGKKWIRADTPSGIDATIRAVAFGNAQIAIAAGDNGTLLRSEDGGKTWTNVAPSKISTYFRSVEFSKNNSVLVAGERFPNNLFAGLTVPWQGPTPTLLESKDDGKNWTWIRPPYQRDYNLRSIAVGNRGFGLAVGDRLFVAQNESGSKQGAQITEGFQIMGGGILATPDGQAWSESPTMGFARLFAATTIGETTGIAVGDAGWIVRTANGGASWERAETPEGIDKTLLDVSFYKNGIGISVGEGGVILRTNDGGVNWYLPELPDIIAYDLHAIARIGSKGAVAVGALGTILQTQDGGNTWTNRSRPSGQSTTLTAVAFPSASSGAAIGNPGTLLWTTNSGKDWAVFHKPEGILNLVSLAFANESTGVAVGLGEEKSFIGGTIVRTDNAGKTWERIPLPSGVESRLLSVTFLNETTAVAIGENGTIIRSSTGGKNWAVVPTPSEVTSSLRAIAFLGLVGIIVGDNGVVLRSQDGGEKWSLIELPQAILPEGTSVSLEAVAFASSSLVSIAGSSRTALYSEDGGRSWSKATTPLTEDQEVKAIDFASATTGVAIGTHAYLANTRDGGKTWKRPALEGSTDLLEGISFNALLFGADSQDSIIVGDGGVRVSSSRIVYAPYVKNWQTSVSQELSATVALKLEIAAENDQPVKKVSAEYGLRSKSGNIIWKRLPSEIEQSSHDGLWRASWKPADEGIAEGTEIRHRLTFDDGDAPLSYEELPSIQYRTLFNRLLTDHKTFLLSLSASISIIGIYLLFILSAFVFSPIRFVTAGSGAGEAASALAESGATWTKAVVGLLRQTTFPWLKRRTRVRRAWLEAYGKRAVTFDDLDAQVREDFLKHDEVLDAWVSRRIDKGRSALDKSRTFTTHPLYISSPVRVGESSAGRIIDNPNFDSIRFALAPDRAIVKIWSAGVMHLREAGISTPEIVIERICSNGIIERRDIAGTAILEFVLDPVAEYLGRLRKV
jgi:photosystem II stability/assembly factor-like uncharacterized protein